MSKSTPRITGTALREKYIVSVLILLAGMQVSLVAQTKPVPPARPAILPKSTGSTNRPPATVAPAAKTLPPKPVQLPAPAQAHTARARAFEAIIKGKSPTIYGDTGGLISGETALESLTAGANLPKFLSGQMFHAAIVGQSGQTHAESSVADLELDIGDHHISASYLAGRADANCQRAGAAFYWRTEILNLVVDGQSVRAPSVANQRIWWKDGYLSLNEQTGGASGGVATTSIIALRVVLNNGDSVSVGRAEAAINCAYSQPCENDFICGSGWLASSNSRGRLNFAVAMSRKSDATIGGHLVLEDSGSNIRFSTQGATSFTVNPSNNSARQISGEGTLNGRTGVKYRLELVDGGDRAGGDRVMLFLANGYIASGYLQAGNLHLAPCR